MKVLFEIQKPQNIEDGAWIEQRSKAEIYFQTTSGRAAIVLKDYEAADEAFKSILSLTPQAR